MKLIEIKNIYLADLAQLCQLQHAVQLWPELYQL